MRVLLVCLALAGCHRDDDDVIDRTPRDLSARVQDFATNTITDGGGTGGLGSGRARPASSTALHVGANQSATVPNGQYGFTVTANGTAGWRVAWVDAAQLGFRFHGSVFTDTGFDAVSSTGMSYATLADNLKRLDFESAPGAVQVGWVDFVSFSQPIIVDGLVGASDGTLYYPSNAGATLTVATPASFVSP